MSDRYSDAARDGWNGSPPNPSWGAMAKAYHEWGSLLNKLFTDAHGQHEVWPDHLCGLEFHMSLWSRGLSTAELYGTWMRGPRP